MANRIVLSLALTLAASTLGCKQVQDLIGAAGGGAAARFGPGASRTARAPVTDGTGPKVVPGPGTMPECFAQWAKDTKFLQWPARTPPYRIAIVNGYVGNAWRIQMVKTAKAFAKRSRRRAAWSRSSRSTSTGTNLGAQLASAIEDFVKQGFDAVVTLAVSPTGLRQVSSRFADQHDVLASCRSTA